MRSALSIRENDFVQNVNLSLLLHLVELTDTTTAGLQLMTSMNSLRVVKLRILVKLNATSLSLISTKTHKNTGKVASLNLKSKL